jgi:hypothetical protein
MVAIRYRISLEEARDMAADDFLDACSFLGVTG